MSRLTRRDLLALLEGLRGIYAVCDLDAFPRRVVSELPKLVGSSVTAYNEVNPRKRRVTGIMDPSDARFPDSRIIFERHIPEHPLIARYERTRDGRAFKISDFVTPPQFHRLGLYNEFYRRVDVEHQMAFTLPAPPPLVIGIALNRGRPDFSERDRLLLNLLRPHVVRAYGNAQAFTGLQRELALVRQGVETLGRGLVSLAPDGCLRVATTRARAWLTAYFGPRAGRGERLPDALDRWVRHELDRLTSPDTVPAPRAPLVVDRDDKRLVVRLLTESAQTLLLLEEQRTALEPDSLAPLGLTRREAEVLVWVAQGKTNAEVAAILGMRPRTVHKHLDHVFRKLGVENRTAAAALALASTASSEAQAGAA